MLTGRTQSLGEAEIEIRKTERSCLEAPDSEQLGMSVPARLSLAVAAAHWTGRTKDIAVPKTWWEAHAVFWLHPTPVFAVSVLLALAVFRLGAPLALLDVAGA